jgi:sugar-phosphatase
MSELAQLAFAARLICDAIIFDLDGVLIDSNGIAERHLRAWADRQALPFERMAAIQHGRTTVETIRLVAPHLDAGLEADLMEQAEADDTEGLLAFAGAVSLLARLPAGRWAIATSATRRTAVARLAWVGLPTPEVLVSADDVASGKPAPDAYRLAAERLGVAPWRCVAVEDAPAGVESAQAAGCRVVGVASTLPAGALSGADVIVARLADLAAEIAEGALLISWPAAAEYRSLSRKPAERTDHDSSTADLRNL